MPFSDRTKAIVGAIIVLGSTCVAVWADHVIDQGEIQVVLAALLTLLGYLGVYHAKNQPAADPVEEEAP